MELEQSNNLRMLKGVLEVCKGHKHQPLWAGIPAFTRGVNGLEVIVNDIDSTQVTQEGDTTGVTTSKNKKEEELVQVALEIAGAITAYASETSNAELIKKVDFSHTDLIHVRDSETRSRTQQIHNVADGIINQLADQGITAADTGALQTLINEYEQLIGKQGLTKEESQTATGRLDILFNEGNELLKERLDKMMIRFKRTNNHFFTTYWNSREIYNLGVRKSVSKIEDQPV